MSRSRTLLLAALAVVPFACSGDETQEDPAAQVRAELSAAVAANGELSERLDDLESQLEDLAETPDDGALEDVTASLGGLTDRLDAIDRQLADEASAREEMGSAADEAASDLRRTLDAVRGAVDDLQGEVDELRTLYETLRDRLDRQQRG